MKLRSSCNLVALVLLVGCSDDETVWVPFNSDENAERDVVVEVRECDDPAAATNELKSSLGQVTVGVATVEPGCGPVGTTHELKVEVLEEWADIVGRVTVDVIPGASADIDGDGEDESRGDLELRLERDSAAVGTYVLTLQSQGVVGEQRTDIFRITLLQPQELDALVDTEEDG